MMSKSDHTQSQFASPQVAVISVTYKGDELLLVQRANEPHKYGWGFPGGKVHPGEALYKAACRELFEETQVRASAEQKFDVIEINECDAQGKHYHFILVAILCRYVSGTAIASDDALDCKWMSLEQIITNQHQLIPHVASVAQRAANLRIK